MKKFLCTLAITISCFGSTGSPLPDPTPHIIYQECEDPWFTGPLLAPSAHVVPIGYINIEPYVFYTVTTGAYDSDWNSISTPNVTVANFQFLFYLGLTEWADILFAPQASWNSTMGTSSASFGDFSAELDLQVYENREDRFSPSVKFYVREIFPTGKYDRGNPDKFGTDIGGEGTFCTSFGFVLSMLHEFPKCHFLNWRFNPFYAIPTKVHVKGINFYGGAPNTKGTVTPEMQFGAIFAVEYTLSKHWVFSVDLEGIYGTKRSFKGFPGTVPEAPNTPLILSRPDSLAFSIAPALEYNFNASFGIIAGSWFTFAGKNAPKFYSAVIAINYYGPLSPETPKKGFRTHGGGGGGGGR